MQKQNETKTTHKHKEHITKTGTTHTQKQNKPKTTTKHNQNNDTKQQLNNNKTRRCASEGGVPRVLEVLWLMTSDPSPILQGLRTRGHLQAHRARGTPSLVVVSSSPLPHTFTHIHTQSHTFTHIHTQSHTVTQSHTITHNHTHSHTFTHLHTPSHTFTHIHTHSHTFTHTHTHYVMLC